ncbi:hypothetical protein ACP70R_013593 [Stipagrostis hirtigluma subsp. patula]
MALEAVVFSQGHFGCGWADSPYALPWCDLSAGAGAGGFGDLCVEGWDHELAASVAPNSVDEWGDAVSKDQSSDGSTDQSNAAAAAAAETGVAAGRRKRRRAKVVKNKEEIETQRMTHIAVERNRRRQMNEYLAVLRSLMPPSYAHRGDQASIVGGAINYVRELEQLLQSLEAQKSIKNRGGRADAGHSPFAGFFSFPQYSTSPSSHSGCGATSVGSSSSTSNVNGYSPADAAAESSRPAAVADIEVTMVEGHASLKVLARRRPKQLLKLVAGLHQLRVPPLHLNMTTVDAMVLYTFCLKVEDDSKMGSVEDIATAVHEILSSIQQQQEEETAVM